MLLLCSGKMLFAQSDSRILEVEQRLDLLKEMGMPLDQPVTIAFEGPIREFLPFLGEASKLNLTVAAEVSANVSVTFNGAPARDIILYLCNAYKLDFRVTGNILEFVPYIAPLEQPAPRDLKILYNPATDQLTINLYNDTLYAVGQRLSELTGQNIIIDPTIRNVQISGFVTGVNLEVALKQLAESNFLVVKRESTYFKLEPQKVGTAPATSSPGSYPGPEGSVGNGVISIERLGADKISVTANGADVLEIAKVAAQQLGLNYFVLPKGGLMGDNAGGNVIDVNNGDRTNLVTIHYQNISYIDLLNNIFRNTDYAYRLNNGLFMLGNSKSETLWSYRNYTFQNRSARGILKSVPEELLAQVTIDSIMELNSIVVSGAQDRTAMLVDYFTSIDKLIPEVLIEVIVLDVQSDKLSDLGIEAGVAGNVKPGGSIISSTEDRGGVNFNFSPGAVNDLLRLLEGNGFLKLGRVNADFYLSLRAVQQDGLVDVKSTPKLSTLNSYKASLSIGQKRYYQEQQVVYPGNDRPIPIQANLFREVEANLDLEISPVVSGDEQVTMEISFEQSEFIGESSPNAPPPQVKRSFKSTIRVKNGEMVVLGGLERESKSRTRRGLPWLSKVPLLGWLFGRTRKAQSKSKLLIFVKPTIIS